MSAIITNNFRKNAANLFVEDIATQSTDASPVSGYYIGVGKSDPWPDENTPPAPLKSEIDKQDAIANLISLKSIESGEVERLLPKTNTTWTSGRTYKSYDPTDDTCFNVDVDGGGFITKYQCYILGSDGALYLCLGNDNSTSSSNNPTTLGLSNGSVGQFTATDADKYIWVKIGTPSPASDFVQSDTFFEIPTDVVSSSTQGLLYGFKVVDGGTGYTNGNQTVDLQVTQLDGTSETNTSNFKALISDGVVQKIVDATDNDLQFDSGTLENTGYNGSANGIKKATVSITGAGTPTSEAIIQPLYGPPEGFGGDNLNVFPPFYIGISSDFVQDDGGETLTDIKFRQVSIIKDAGYTDDSETPTDNTVRDSLSYITLDGTSSLTSGDFSGWYFEVSSTNERAWIDKIDGDKIYFHQNSSLHSGEELPSSQNTITIYDENGTSQGTDIYNSVTQPEHDDYTGQILFLENRLPITRSDVQTEKVRIILQF